MQAKALTSILQAQAFKVYIGPLLRPVLVQFRVRQMAGSLIFSMSVTWQQHQIQTTSVFLTEAHDLKCV